MQHEDELDVLVAPYFQLTADYNQQSESDTDSSDWENSGAGTSRGSGASNGARGGRRNRKSQTRCPWTEENEGGGTANVALLDNLTGRIVKRIRLEERWDILSDHKVEMDLDVLVHIVKSGNQSRLFFYRLKEAIEDACDFVNRDPNLANSGRKKLRRKKKGDFS